VRPAPAADPPGRIQATYGPLQPAPPWRTGRAQSPPSDRVPPAEEDRRPAFSPQAHGPVAHRASLRISASEYPAAPRRSIRPRRGLGSTPASAWAARQTPWRTEKEECPSSKAEPQSKLDHPAAARSDDLARVH